MEYAIDTRCIHGEGHRHPDENCAISYPIYQTASFSHLTPGKNPNGLLPGARLRYDCICLRHGGDCNRF